MKSLQKGFAIPLIIAIIAILAVGGGIYVYQNKKTEAPVVAPTISVSLEEQFTLRKNQVAKIGDTGLEVEITAFYNSPCSAGAQCLWSGVGIGFEYRLSGQVQKGIDLIQAFGYRTRIIKTDHETYADLVVEKNQVPPGKPSIIVTGIPIVGQNIYPGSKVPFLNFTIKASGKDVTIDSFIIQKKGMLRTNAITKLILVDNNNTEVAQGTPFSQYDSSNFTKPITIKAGETKTFWLHAWIDPNLSAADKNQHVTLAISAINPSDWQNVGVLGNWAVTSNTMIANLLEDTNPAPVLNSINPSTGTIGTEFTLSGQNLNGFEGTTHVTLVSSNGQKGVIEVNSYAPQGVNTLKFILPSRICTVAMGESGNPCPSYFAVTPGSYKIYAQPWSKPSNQLNLTIVTEQGIFGKVFSYGCGIEPPPGQTCGGSTSVGAGFMVTVKTVASVDVYGVPSYRVVGNYTTDQNGAYKSASLAPGKYLVCGGSCNEVVVELGKFIEANIGIARP